MKNTKLILSLTAALALGLTTLATSRVSSSTARSAFRTADDNVPLNPPPPKEILAGSKHSVQVADDNVPLNPPPPKAILAGAKHAVLIADDNVPLNPPPPKFIPASGSTGAAVVA